MVKARKMRILLSTDNHLGFMEKDPVRSNDSFRTFEEILQIACERDVDFILLGGDLFHDNRPSRKTMVNTMELLRRYCHGDRPSSLQLLSDSAVNFPNRFPIANFNDPNINISMPVFSIHGNHDDPSGDGHLCALDLLSVAGLVNYFGKSREIEQINVSPILIVKDETKLALYGVGNIRDERLYRLYSDGKVTMLRPPDSNDWFNLLVIHQNRVAHGQTNYIPERFISNFFNLVFWGHEHECCIDPCHNSDQQFYITQPGSSVATSLSEGESKTKHVGILTIEGKSFDLEKIRLKTVRPFIMQDIVLREIPNLDVGNVKEVEKFLKIKIESLIDSANRKWQADNGHTDEADDNIPAPLPLIRLRVEYSGDAFNTYNRQRFGRLFTDKVANPNDILHLHRKRPLVSRTRQAIGMAPGMPEPMNAVQLESLLTEFLKTQSLSLLPGSALNDAVKVFVDKDDKDAIKEFIDKTLVKTRGKLNRRKEIIKEEEILLEVENERKLNETEQSVSEAMEVEAPDNLPATLTSDMADDHGRSNRRNDGNRNVIQSIAAEENDIIMIRELPSSEAENLDEDEFIPVNAPRPRSRKQPAAGKASKTVTKRGRKPASPAVEEDIVLVSDSDEDKPKVAPSRRGKRTVQVDTDGDDTTGDYSETEDLTSAAKTSASSNARQSSRRKAANNDAAAPPKKRQTSIIAAFKQNQDIQQQSSSSSHSKTATPASKWPSRRR